MSSHSPPVIHLRRVPLSRLPFPSLAVSLTSAPHDSNAPVEVLSMTDYQQASRRQLHINMQPKDSDPLMKTIDTRFAGSFAYTAKYTTDQSPRATAHLRRTTSSSLSSRNTDDDDASTTSTTEADLNREFEAEVDSNTEITSAIGDDDDELSELGLEFEPPLHIPPPSATGRRLPPLHRQPASLASLAQIPPWHKFENACVDGIPMRVFGGTESSRPPSPWGSSSTHDSDALRALPRASASGRFASAGFLRGVAGLLRALWRKVTVVGGVILHECTKDL